MPAASNPERITEGGNTAAAFKCFVIGGYDLPSLPSTTGSSPSSQNKASLPVVTCTIGSVTLSSGTPKSKHPTNRSYRYDSALAFSNMSLKQVFSETATFRIMQQGVEIASVAVPVNSLPIASKAPAKAGEVIYTLKPSVAVSPDSNPESAATATQPTLRLTLTLTGSLRPEVASLQSASTAYFAAIDTACDAVSPYASKVKDTLNTRYAIIPALPVVITLSCMTPVFVGVAIVGLPLFLPLFVISMMVSTCAAAGLFALYLSTPDGRRRVNKLAGPTVDKLVTSAVGKQFLYATGPRPSPVSLAETCIPIDMTGKLVTSLALDFVGSCSYLIPGAGEAFDIFWAPFQTICIQAMYDKGNPYIKYVSFAEEMIPFTDALPTASLGWLREFGPQIVMGLKERADQQLVKYKK
jgi:hypothetical protein